MWKEESQQWQHKGEIISWDEFLNKRNKKRASKESIRSNTIDKQTPDTNKGDSKEHTVIS